MNKKIAIFFLGDYRFDGRCCNMIETLTKKNKVTIYHNQDINFSITNTNKNLIITNISISKIKWIKYIAWFWNIYKKNIFNYDQTIASDLYSLFPLACKQNKQNIIYDSREIYTALAVHENNKIKNYILSIIEKISLRKVRIIITTANTDQEYLKKRYINYKNIKYYNVYNFPQKFDYKKNDFLREKLNISSNNKILLYQGVIQKNRGITQLIKIINNTENICGVIIGYGEYKKYFINMVNKMGLMKKIFFLEKTPYNKLLKITSSADIGFALIPSVGISNNFALPNKLFEYSVAGVPTLATPLPNMKKAIKKYNLGECIDYNDLESQINFILNIQKQNYFNNRIHEIQWSSQEELFNNIIINE